MTDNEHLLADEAYEIDKHRITPYKMPIARQPSHKAFNRAHSVERVKIEHAFGVLKARWPSLKSLSIRIGDDVWDHLRVANWIIARLVLHNFLSWRDGEDGWLAEAIAKAIREDQPDLEEAQAQDEVELESSQAMRQAGERLTASVREVIAH